MLVNKLDPDSQAVLLEACMKADVYEPRPRSDSFGTRTISILSTDSSLAAVRTRLQHAYVTNLCALESAPYGNASDRFLSKKMVGGTMFSALSSICVAPLPSVEVVIVFMARVLSYASRYGSYLFEYPLERLVQLAAVCGEMTCLRAMLDADVTKYHHGMALSNDMRCRRPNAQLYDNPIDLAIMADKPDAVRELVPFYLTIVSPASDIQVLASGPTPQHKASELGRTRCLEAMAEAGAQLDDEEYNNYLPTSRQTPSLTVPGLSTPLAAALRAGKVETARFLISRGAEVTWRAICAAVYGREADGLALCFEHASAENIDHWLHRGGASDVSLVNLAIVEGAEDCLRLILDRRPPLDLASSGDAIGLSRAVTPLCLAAAMDKPALVHTLLVAGASRVMPLAQVGYDAGYRSALTLASQRGNRDVIEMLLTTAASPYDSVSDQFQDLFESFRVACRAGRQSCAEMLLGCLDSGKQGVLSVLPEDNVLEILLMLVRDVEFLVQYRHVQWYTTRCGLAPLLCTTHLTGKGQTALHVASTRRDCNMVEALLDCMHPPCRICLDEFDSTGATALILCIKSENIVGMRALLRFGADVEQADRGGVALCATVRQSRAAVR